MICTEVIGCFKGRMEWGGGNEGVEGWGWGMASAKQGKLMIVKSRQSGLVHVKLI